MVTRRSRRFIPWYSTTSLFFKVTFHTFNTFNTLLARYTEVNATINNLFYMNIIVFHELLIEIDNVVKVNHVSRMHMYTLN